MILCNMPSAQFLGMLASKPPKPLASKTSSMVVGETKNSIKVENQSTVFKQYPVCLRQ